MKKQEKNLWQRYFGVGLKAQMATLLTLIIAIIFLFLAITINIGKVSQKKTVLSNAADASALQYASSIGSFSHYLSCTYLKCKRKICQWSWSLFFKAMMWMGILGIVVGLALAALGLGEFGVGLGGIFGGALGYATNGPMHYMEADAWKGLSRQFKKLSNQMKFKEGIFLAAMMKTVDDPNLIIDEHDLDEDGLTDDKIPQFLRFYYNRLKGIKERYTDPMKDAIDILKGKMQTFDEQSQDFKTYLNDTFIPLLEDLKRCGYMVSFWESGGGEEPIPCRGDDDHDPICSPEACTIYEEGCDAPPGQEEEECISCDTCYEDYLDSLLTDEVDIIIWDIDDFHEFVFGLLHDEEGNEVEIEKLLEKLLESISDWLPQLYDGTVDPCTGLSNTDDYYDVLGKWDTFISGWISQLESIDESIGRCIDDPYSECSADSDDEGDDQIPACCCSLGESIAPAIDELEAFQERIRDFQEDIYLLYTTESNLTQEYERRSKVYSWGDRFENREGAPIINHYVEVKVGPFAMPRIKTYTKDHKKCAELVNHSGAVWVEISRYDEPHSGYPLWRFRYHPQGDRVEEARCASYGNDIFDHAECQKYLIKAKSTANYNYTANPPSISRRPGAVK